MKTLNTIIGLLFGVFLVLLGFILGRKHEEAIYIRGQYVPIKYLQKAVMGYEDRLDEMQQACFEQLQERR